jgi:hypothetical protein
MPSAEATPYDHKQIPFSIARVSSDRISYVAKRDHIGSVRDAEANGLNLSGYQLILGCVVLEGAAWLLFWGRRSGCGCSNRSVQHSHEFGGNAGWDTPPPVFA